MSVTTACVWVCGKCGRVSHLDGAAAPSALHHEVCRGTHGGHVLKPVIVVVPYA